MGSADISVVVTKINNVLIVTLPNELSRNNLDQVRTKTLAGLTASEVKAVVFECSALEYLDLYEFFELKNVFELSRILGIKPYLVSLSPGIIKFLIASDAEIDSINAFLSLNEALSFLEKN
jgi:anti-anti-sigma regulatory factor